MTALVITSEAVRELSHHAFRSRYRIEVALAILELDETFVYDDLWELIAKMASSNDIEPPSQSKVRGELQRLRELGILQRMPKIKGTLIQREVRRESSLWPLCRELQALALAA